MNLDTLEKEIRVYMAANWADTEIAHANHHFNPDGNSWVRLTFLYSDPVFGDTVTDIEKGFLYIDIFTPVGTGTKLSRELAEKARGLFRNKVVSGIPFSQVSVKPKGEAQGYYHTQVIAHFDNFIE